MGTPAAQCKGKFGRHSTGSEAVPADIIRHCTDSVPPQRQQATVPFLKRLRSSPGFGGGGSGRCGAVYRARMLVLC